MDDRARDLLLFKSPSRSGPLCLCDVLVDECQQFHEPGDDEHPSFESPIPDAVDRQYDALLHEEHGARLAAIYQHIFKLQCDNRRPRAALCLSGGGIRSATFALGLMQGLARHNLLDKFDYLSTVSGGGYIGSWLSAWIRRASLPVVLKQLRTEPGSPIDVEPAAITHLRAYSNYLSPRLGITSVDAWTCLAMIFRNWILNWLVIVPLLIAFLAIPRLLLSLQQWQPPIWVPTAAYVLAMISTACCTIYIAFNLPSTGVAGGRNPRASQKDFLRYTLAPLCLASLLLTMAWGWFLGVQGRWYEPSADMRVYSVFGWSTTLPWGPAFLLVVLGVVTQVIALVFYAYRYASNPRRKQGLGWTEVGALVLLGLVDFVMVAVATVLIVAAAGQQALDPRENPIGYLWTAAPVLLTLFSLPPILFLPITTRLNRNDEDLEWWTRTGAWFLIVLLGWILLCGLVFYGPLLIYERAEVWSAIGGITGVTTLAGGFSGKSPAREDRSGPPDLRAIIAANVLTVAALVFALFVVIGLSWLTTEAIALAYGLLPGLGELPEGVRAVDGGHLFILTESPLWLTALLVAGGAALGFFMSWFVTVNKFSMHALYRNRLIRAYLGASNPRRRANPFTGFDDNDNLAMYELLAENGPEPRPQGARRLLHVIGITLNLVTGAQLARQERKAESFTISPLHGGSGVTHAAAVRSDARNPGTDDDSGRALGYRRTLEPPDPQEPDEPRRHYGGVDGVSLGTAVTISGAAASPNMGYQSSSIVAFMMTLFNVRLGWWLGNPGVYGDNTYRQPSPRMSIFPLIQEAFGLTDGRKGYVYLSDGGHFENLALYEMVLRRCRVIVVSDAGQDEEYVHESLAGAIRKIRIDMGIEIEMGEISMSPEAELRGSNKVCAVGVIRYSCVDGGGTEQCERDGVLIYVKPIITNREPSDVLHYARANTSFPQQSTGDQFFSESQFESYRELGRNTIAELCDFDWEEQAANALRAPDSNDAREWNGRNLDQFVRRVTRYVETKRLPRRWPGPWPDAQAGSGDF